MITSMAIETNSSRAPMSFHPNLRYHEHAQSPIDSWPEFLYRLQTEEIDHLYLADFLGRQWHVSVYFSVLYIGLLFFGLKWMKNREPYNLRFPLAVWSGALSLFSLFGTIVVWPELVQLLFNENFLATYCKNSFVEDNRVVYWYTVFTLSKVAELVDTAFIVLRKQRLITLHWVHHVLTLCFSFYVYGDMLSTSRWMVAMNFAIHTVMYGYYSLRALRVSIPRPVAMVITTGQIAQMIFGFFIYSHILFGGLAETSLCKCTLRGSVAGFLLYALFFYYFVRFFFDSYLTKPKVSKEKTIHPRGNAHLLSNDLNNNNNQIELQGKKVN